MQGLHIKPEHVLAAIKNLSRDVPEGAIGAGAGTTCFGFKSGIGTASRVIPKSATGEPRDYIVGALLQTNFNGNLNIYGQYLPYKPLPRLHGRAGREASDQPCNEEKGSCMIIAATDAPMSDRQLTRLAKRAVVGITQTGSFLSHHSGDFVIAFSNCEKNLIKHNAPYLRTIDQISDNQLDPFFEAIAEAVMEAVYNSLTTAETINGYKGHTAKAFDIFEYGLNLDFL
jgi:D-aminopeptidase